MSRPKDDDLALIDPYVQSLRKSQVDILRKLCGFLNTMGDHVMPVFYEQLTEDEQEAYAKLVQIVNRKEKA